MPTDPQNEGLEQGLPPAVHPQTNQLSKDLRDVSKAFSITATVFSGLKAPLSLANKFLQSPEKMRVSLQKAEDNLKVAEKLLDVFGKVAILRPLTKIVKPVIVRLDKKIDDLEDKLQTISTKAARHAEFIEAAKDQLKLLQIAAYGAAVATDLAADRAAGVDFTFTGVAASLRRVGDAFDIGDELGLPPLPTGTARVLQPRTEGDAPPIEGIDEEATIALGMGLSEMFINLGDKTSETSSTITALAAKLDPINAAAARLEELVNAPVFALIEKFSDAVESVTDAFATIFGPLQIVYDYAGPVIDALGSVFGFILAPLEFALEAIVEATGIGDLLDKLAAEIEGLLPDIDLGLLDEIELQLDELFEVEFPDLFFNDIVNPLELDVLGVLNADGFPPSIAVPTSGDDSILGEINFSGPQSVDGLSGNDLLVGGEFNDTLNGDSGADTLIGGPGDDVLDGGSNPDGRPDVVIYKGSIDDYGIASILSEDGFNSGVWVVADYREDETLGGEERYNAGTDRLIDVEQIVFDDYVVPIGEIDTFIRTQSLDGEFARVTPTDTTLPPVDGVPQLTADPGIDRIFGGEGFDVLLTAGGNDQLSSSDNGGLTIDIQGAAGDWLDGGEGNDLFLATRYSALVDQIYGGPGEDSINYRASDFGLAVFLAAGADAEAYRPVSISIDADFDGRDFGLTYRGGLIRDVENIEGTDFGDYFWGSDANNKINGGGGNDQIRGLGGDDILHGGDGNDILVGDAGNDVLYGGAGANEYVAGLGDDIIIDISSSFSIVKYSAFAETAHYNQSVNFVEFATTGVSELTPLDMPGAIVIFPGTSPSIQQVSKYATSVVIGDRYGVDYLDGVDRIVGSTGGDIIYAAFAQNQTIYGNDGDDQLFSGSGESNSTFYGGPDNDSFVSGSNNEDTFFGGEDDDTVTISGDTSIDGDSYFGDDNRVGVLPGTDTIDFSGSDYAWHIYLLDGTGKGVAAGKFEQNIADAEAPRYIQPTLGINGVVEKLPGTSIPGEEYPGVPEDLRNADPNSPNPGGRTDSIGEWDIYIGSENRDIFTLGGPDGAITGYGNGGNDVLFGLQQFGDQLYGGAGNDILGTLNQEYSNDADSSLFDADKMALLDGGEGDDLFVAGDFQEDIRGGGGIDELTYEASRAAVTVDLISGELTGGYAQGDAMSGIEYLTGSQFDDTLRGDEQLNQLLGWEGNDELHGRGGPDFLYGDEGDDLLLGGDGNDLLHGGNGGDTLNGGAGSDTASWNLYQIHPKGGAQRLTNDLSGVQADLAAGTAGSDVLIDIENLQGGVGNDELLGDDTDNALIGDLGDDLLDGRGGNDALTGGEGDDTVRGGDGDDWLGGGAGTNTLEGGSGNDTIDYGVLEYGVTIEMAGVGSRTGFDSGVANSFTPVDFFVWTDSLTTTAGPTGAVDDIIDTGTDEVRYTYQTFDQGTDDPGDDTFRQEDPITPERIWRLEPFFAEKPSDLDEVRFLPDVLLPEQDITRVDRFEVATDFFQSVETIAGSQGNDSFLGNDEDTLFYGGPGADTIDGGDGADTASYEFSEFAVNVDLAAGIVSGGDADGDVLLNIEHLIGSASADVLAGNDFANRLTLGGGNDTASGGAGTDTVVLEFARDAAIIQFYDNGLRIVQADGVDTLSIDFVENDVELFEFSDGTFSYDALAETVITGTASDDTIIGTAVADPIDGRAGNDRIEGREDNDTLAGGTGNDTLVGERGDDRLDGGADEDRFEGGPGDDTFVVDSASEITVELAGEGSDTVESTVSLTLQEQIENLLLLGSADLQGSGNSLDNALTGNSGDNTLTGFGGADSLDGGSGADLLIGGTGDDHYTVDNIGDVVEELGAEGVDTVATFIDYTLPETAENLEVAGVDGISVKGNNTDNRIIDSDGDNTLDGGFGTDTAVFSFALADASFGYEDGAFLVHFSDGTDRLLNIEAVQFSDELLTMDELVELAYPTQDVQLFAGDRYETDYAIDMTIEGGGKQFIFFDTRNQDSSNRNRYFFDTEFFDERGKAYFEGTNLDDPERAQVDDFRVDFSGGNTTQLSVQSFDFPLQTMIDADWNFYQIAIFGGDDRITGSYYDDKLVGYRGNDIIFGGLGDKEGYNVEGSSPSNRPSTLRDPGDAVTNPDFWVHDGNDLIDGAEGDDLIDGGTGNDTLLGGDGNDQLWGGGDAGEDRFDGGEGNDTYTGGAGADVFVLTPYMGADTVTDFEVGIDSLDITALEAAGTVSSLVVVGDDTLITLSDGSSLTLLSVQVQLAGFNAPASGSVTISGSATQGQTLSAQTSGISDDNGVGTLSFQWLRDGNAIDGAIGATYTADRDDVGSLLTVRVSFIDGGGIEETLTSEPSVAVEGVNSPATGTVTIIGTPIQGGTLSASNTLADPDGLGDITYRWNSGGTDRGTGMTLLLTQADIGNSISVIAAYTDGGGFAESVSSDSTGPVEALVEGPLVNTRSFIDVSDFIASGSTVREVTGVLAGTGADEGVEQTFSIQNGAPAEDGQVKAGKFGDFLLDTRSGAYRYVPNTDAIASANADDSEVFIISVSDGAITQYRIINVADFENDEFVFVDPDDDGRLYDAQLILESGATIIAEDVQLYRTYAGALGRTPDVGGFNWWAGEIAAGRKVLADLGADFIWSPEFLSYFEGATRPDEISSDDFILHMYNNVFGREPDAGGFAFWTGVLDTGSKSQGQVVLEMTQSNEFVGLTALAAVDFLIG